MIYQLWDKLSASLLEDSEDPDEVLAYVRAFIDSNGPEITDRLSFLVVSEDDTVAYEQVEGAALLARAKERIPA